LGGADRDEEERSEQGGQGDIGRKADVDGVQLEQQRVAARDEQRGQQNDDERAGVGRTAGTDRSRAV